MPRAGAPTGRTRAKETGGNRADPEPAGLPPAEPLAAPEKTLLVAEVAPAVPTSGGEGVFDYRVPPELADRVAVGARLIVPLHGRPVEGYCVRLKSETDVAPDRLRDVRDVVDPRPAYPPALLDLAVWTAGRYLCQPGEVLRAAVPARGRFKDRTRAKLAVAAAEAEAAATSLESAAPVQAAVLRSLARGPADPAALRRRLGPQVTRSLRSLEARGLVTLAGPRRRVIRRNGQEGGPVSGPASGPEGTRGPGVVPGIGVTLTRAQEAALAAVTAAVREAAGRGGEGSGGPGRGFLLHGVTGSGKTEVYLRAAAETLALGRQVLLLVPEVSLVPQTVERVKSHLGPARVAVAHSYLGGLERLEAWGRVVAGEADVVVGARSAVFLPLARLGLIVLDEEHEDSYKQEESAPRYHAREVASRRSEREGAVLVLASATPALDSYHRALSGEYTLLSLPERVKGRGLPPVEVVDMRAELAAGNRGLFSRSLQAALSLTLREGRQAILFLNRRGHSTFVLCRDCGWVARCPNCDVSLTYHDPEADLFCHWCGHHAPAPARCPGCGGHRVRYFGAGTQRVEDEVRLRHPEARVVRLDADVVRRPGEASRVLALFESGQADVLVGTQMVAKGLDVPGVDLVAAVAADSALHLPDFRAAERTFRLLTQAAGRAGRGDRPGRVVIQTYNPDHPAVAAAARHDYLSFAQAELEARRTLGYPPFSHLVRVEFSDPDESRAREASSALARALGSLGFSGSGETLSGVTTPGRPRYAGPAAAPLARLRGRFRWHVLVFCPDLESGLRAVREAVRLATGREARGGRRRAPVGPVASVDVDPVSVL